MLGYNELVELCKRTKATKGLDTSIEKVVEYQDMIGHSSEAQLHDLSNGDYKKEFYWIYSTAYRIEDTLNFYVGHSEKIGDMLRENCILQDDLQTEKEAKANLQFAYKELQTKNNELQTENYSLKKSFDDLQLEVIQLKAKLYDLTNK